MYFFDNLFEDISVRLLLSKYGIDQIVTLNKKSNKVRYGKTQNNT